MQRRKATNTESVKEVKNRNFIKSEKNRKVIKKTADNDLQLFKVL